MAGSSNLLEKAKNKKIKHPPMWMLYFGDPCGFLSEQNAVLVASSNVTVFNPPL